MILRASALLVLCACDGSTTTPSCLYGTGSSVVVAAVSPDYMSSGVGALPLDGTPATLLGGSLLGSDPALATSAARYFFIARDLDTFFEVDRCGNGLAEYSARTPGECTAQSPQSCVDPQDVAVASDGSFWVARFNVPSLLVMPPPGSMAPDNVVDMSAFDPLDGNPHMSSVRILGNNAFVALERITQQSSGTFVAQQTSQVAVLDTTSFKTVATVTLAGRNPFGQMVELNGSLWLADAGNFASSEGNAGIEVLDTTTMTSTLLIAEPTLGGWVAEVAPSATCGAAIVSQAEPPGPPTPTPTWLVAFAWSGTTASNITTVIQPTTGYDLHGLVWTTDGRLLVGDWRGGPPFPVHTFTVDSACTLTAGPDLTVPTLAPLAFAN